MATNPYINRVDIQRGGTTETLINISDTTATAADVSQGAYFYLASGEKVEGTSTGGTMVIRDSQDSHGGTVREITAGTVVTGTKSITANGTYDVAAYADAQVDVPSAEPELQAKTATPSTAQQVITADSGYDGLSQVTVSAMPSGSATTPTTSITANPSISVNSSTGLITASVSGSKSVTPSVSAGYVSSGTAGTVSVSGSNTSQLTTQAAKTVTPSTSSQTAVAAGRYTTGAVTVAAMPSGTAGTPTATKGSVSNHSVSVTPSVTNTTGYITGGTKTGTAVTVSASELVSGNLAITANTNSTDVTNYATVSVNVPTGGGSSNIAGGSFTTGSTSGAETITVPYTGTGYIKQFIIAPDEGSYNSSGTVYGTTHQYGIVYAMYVKTNATAPTYQSDDSNNCSRYISYKGSTSTPNTLSANSNTNESYVFSQYAASSSVWGATVQFNSSTSISVYVSGESGTRGLLPNTKYNYAVVYSE